MTVNAEQFRMQKQKRVKRTELFPNDRICAVTIYLKQQVEEEIVSSIKDFLLFALRGCNFSKT